MVAHAFFAKLIHQTGALALVLMVMQCSNALAESHAQLSAPAEKVVIGAYINGVHSIDLKAGTVDLDMYLWLRSKGERDLLDSIEIMNGSISEKSGIEKKKIGDENYYTMRISVKVFQNYDLRNFPLDKQQLTVFIEDSMDAATALQFVPDEENTKVAKSVALPGWSVGKAKITVTTNSYDTNYGDLSIGTNSSDFSRASIYIPIEREGTGYFFKLFGTVFLSAAVAFLAFFIRPDDLDPRFGVGLGGIFAVVASNVVLSSMLPETHQFSMGEALLLLTMALIFLSLLESVLALRLWGAGKQATAQKLDRITGWLLPIAYIAICALIVNSYQLLN